MTGDRDANKPAGPKNLPASVRARLLAKARDMGDDYQRILNRFAMERFLYRMGTSDQRDRLVLKGANLFLAWQGALHRATKDLDLEGFGSPDCASVCEVVSQVCAQPGDDGLVFKADSIRGERIREDGLYEGVRVHVVADLGGADSGRVEGGDAHDDLLDQAGQEPDPSRHRAGRGGDGSGSRPGRRVAVIGAGAPVEWTGVPVPFNPVRGSRGIVSTRISIIATASGGHQGGFPPGPPILSAPWKSAKAPAAGRRLPLLRGAPLRRPAEGPGVRRTAEQQFSGNHFDLQQRAPTKSSPAAGSTT